MGRAAVGGAPTGSPAPWCAGHEVGQWADAIGSPAAVGVPGPRGRVMSRAAARARRHVLVGARRPGRPTSRHDQPWPATPIAARTSSRATCVRHPGAAAIRASPIPVPMADMSAQQLGVRVRGESSTSRQADVPPRSAVARHSDSRPYLEPRDVCAASGQRPPDPGQLVRRPGHRRRSSSAVWMTDQGAPATGGRDSRPVHLVGGHRPRRVARQGLNRNPPVSDHPIRANSSADRDTVGDPRRQSG